MSDALLHGWPWQRHLARHDLVHGGTSCGILVLACALRRLLRRLGCLLRLIIGTSALARSLANSAGVIRRDDPAEKGVAQDIRRRLVRVHPVAEVLHRADLRPSVVVVQLLSPLESGEAHQIGHELDIFRVSRQHWTRPTAYEHLLEAQPELIGRREPRQLEL